LNPPNVLAGVVVAGGQPWAVGTFGNPDLGVPCHTLVERWIRSRWVRVPTPSSNGSSINGVAASSGGQLVAVGQIEHADASASPLVERWDGTQWARIAVPGQAQLRGVAAAG
jgi:hypothetical protein